MSTDQLLTILATVLAGVALVAWPFVTSAAAPAGASPVVTPEVLPTAVRAPLPVDLPVVLPPGAVRCEVVLLEAVTSPAGAAVRAGRFVIEAEPAPRVVHVLG